MKKSLIYTLGGVAILSAVAIATSTSIQTITQSSSSNIQGDYSYLDESNNQNQENFNTIDENVATLNEAILDKVNELNNVSFDNFLVSINQLDSIKNLTQENIYKNLIEKSYIERNNQFNYEIVDFKNNLTNKVISFKIRVLNSNNENEYLETNSYSISWTLNTNENIQEINLDELLEMSNNPMYTFGDTYNSDDFKELVYKELSKDRNFDINAKTNYYHTQKGRFISEAESKWEDKKYLIAVDTQTGFSFDVKEQKDYQKYLFRGQIISINKYYVNSITISGQNMLDTWLTKSAQKSTSSIWLFSCPELTKIELEAEKINTQLDQKEVLADTVISQEVFDSNHLYVWQGNNLVNYSNYYISGNKGIGNNLLNPVVQKFLIDSLNYNNNLNFDYENFEYKFTSGRFIHLVQDGYTRKVLVSAQIEIKSKLDGTIINTQPLQFNINVQDIVLFNNPCSVLERMGINMINDGTYGLGYWVDANHYVHYVQIDKNLSIEEENEWFYGYWMNQQKEYVKKTFGVEDPKIEPIIYVKNSFYQPFAQILMDKSKDTFYDTFRAVYGVDYQEAINKLINEGRGSEAALLKSIQKIKIFGKIWETYTAYTNIVTKNFQAGGLQIFLDENETIGFGTGNIEYQSYQRLTFYRWSYKKV